jgi:hypothetical protein
MKRIFAMTLVILLTAVSYGYCANYNNWGGSDLNQLLGRELTYDLVYLGGGRGAVSSEVVTTTTALTPSMSIAIVDVASRTLTVADGIPGQVITLIGKSQSDTGTTTITATTKTGWASAAMADVGDSITLLYVDDTYGWVVVGTNSITVS